MGRGVARRGRNIFGATVVMLRRLLLVLMILVLRRLLVEHAHFVFLEVAKEQFLVNVEAKGEFVT